MKKPTKYIWVSNGKTFDFNYVSKKVSLAHFMEWCKKEVPSKAKDVCLEINEEWWYDDCIVTLEITWQEKVLNESYDKKMKKFLKTKKVK